jgi:hypothetical protein
MRSCVTSFCLLSFWSFNSSTFEVPGSGHVFFQFLMKAVDAQSRTKTYDELKGQMFKELGRPGTF